MRKAWAIALGCIAIIGIVYLAPSHSLAVRAPEPASTADLFTIQSDRLSAFWHRPVSMQARIRRPATLAKATHRAILFHLPGFGGGFVGDETEWSAPPRVLSQGVAILQVSVDASFDTGHHSLVNSDSNGPWGEAFVKEFIPKLKVKLGRDLGNPSLFDSVPLFLTGHSTGGWSAIYLAMHYPDTFAATWATAPDPLDFRDFFGINVTPGSTANVYRQKNGLPTWSSRDSFQTLQSEILEEEAEDERLSEFRSDEWKWSHRLPDGLPARLFDRESGELNQPTLTSWERFDMRRLLLRMSPEERAKLNGKLHIICGEKDTFFLERPTKSFCKALKKAGIQHECVFIPQRDHIDLYDPSALYPEGLAPHIMNSLGKELLH